MSHQRIVRTLSVAVFALLLTGAAEGGPDTPVADAAQRGDLDTVRELLRQGADVNAAQGDGMTALHWAARNGDVEIGEVLLYAGANVHAGTRIGQYTALHMAARAAHAEFAVLLLEANADPNIASTNSGAMPLHLAAASGDVDVVTKLIEWGAFVDATEASWKQTPLMFAAAYDRVDVIRALLAAGADPNAASHTVDVVEQTEADRAADRRLTQFLAEFKEKEGGGTDWRPKPTQVQAAIEVYREVQRKWPDVPSPEDDDKKEESEEVDKAEADSTDTTDSSETAVTSATADTTDTNGPGDAADATGVADQSVDGEESDEEEEEPRPLSYSQLVGSWGGLTPLLHAVRQGHMEAVLALLEGGADINQPSAGDHTQPLLMATINGQFDLAMILIERGADPNGASAAGTTPLFAVLERQWAPRASYAHPVEHEQQAATHLEVIEALLIAGADPNVRLKTHLWFMEYTFSVLGRSGINLRGATPFWRATYALDLDAMRLLKSYGADPTIPTMKPPKRRRRPDPADEEKKAEEEEEDEGENPPGEGDTDKEMATDEQQEEGVENPKKGNAEGESADEEVTEESEDEDEEKDHSGVPPVPVNGPAIYPIHAASGVGYGQSFAGNAHRHVPDNWLNVVRFLVEECGAEIDVRDANAYTPLHHAASRGDNALILYLVEKGADVTALSRKGQTTADMANGPVERVPPYPETVALLESLGSENNKKCISC